MAALNLYISDSLVLNQLKSHLSLHRVKDESQVLYSSAIALQLSQAQNIPALEIANQVASHIRQTKTSLDTADELNFTVQVVPPGLIYLELSEPTIASWLQYLVQVPLCLGRGAAQSLSGGFLRSELSKRREHKRGGESRLPPLHHYSPAHLFAVQYAHARCCSLLQLAQREGLITLRIDSAFWLIATPDPIPWLDSEQKLCLTHSAERALTVQLVGLIDELYCPSPSRRLIEWEKAALNLSQAFQTFYSYCRIWGEIKLQMLQLAQARLGLVAVTQSLLRLLLQDILNFSAPLEL